MTEKSTEHASAKPKKSAIPPEWKPITLREILATDREELEWIIEGLLLKESGLLTSGQPHACKSLGWLAAALDSVTSGLVWGKFPSPSVKKVLYIETEDPEPVVKERVRELARGLNLEFSNPPEGFQVLCTGPFEIVKMESALKEFIDLHKPDWMVVSTLQGLLGERDWKEQKDMGLVNAIFVRLSRKCPLVLITHSP